MKKIPFSAPDVQDSDLQAVESVIRSGWLAHGKYSEKLEELFCEYTGAKYATSVSNCTAGLHLSCLAAGFGPGDEVIVPAQTHTATAHAVEFTGAKAVFADVDPISGNMKQAAWVLWPIFGASNQMLAALTLMILTLYFWKRKKPILPIIIPMIFIMVITLYSLIIKTQSFYNQGNSLLLSINCIMIILIIWMIIEGVVIFLKKQNNK